MVGIDRAIRRARRAVEAMRPGPVVCLHDARTRTVRLMSNEYDGEPIRLVTAEEARELFGSHFTMPEPPSASVFFVHPLDAGCDR